MPLQIPHLSYSNHTIQEGDKGVEQTLQAMAKLVNNALLHEPDIRALALTIVKSVRDKDYMGEITAVYDWVKKNIRYVQDPYDKEMLQEPIRTLQLAQADCDDFASLLASLLMSIGHQCRFVVIKAQKDSETYDHVFVECNPNGNGKWVPLDATNKQNGCPGWEAPSYKKAVMEL